MKFQLYDVVRLTAFAPGGHVWLSGKLGKIEGYIFGGIYRVALLDDPTRSGIVHQDDLRFVRHSAPQEEITEKPMLKKLALHQITGDWRGDFDMSLDPDARILSVRTLQRDEGTYGDGYLLVLEDPNAAKVKRRFRPAQIDWDVPHDAPYIGTYSILATTFHLFEITKASF